MMRNSCIWGSVQEWQRHESWWHLWASRYHAEETLAKINLCWCSNILEDIDSLVTEGGWQQQRPLLRDQEKASVENCDMVLCQRGSHIIGDYFIKVRTQTLSCVPIVPDMTDKLFLTWLRKVLYRGSIPISGVLENKKQKIDQNCSILNVCKRQSVIPQESREDVTTQGL